MQDAVAAATAAQLDPELLLHEARRAEAGLAGNDFVKMVAGLSDSLTEQLAFELECEASAIAEVRPALENLLGHVRFAALYLIAGLGGSVASFWFTDWRVQSLGASGATFQLMARNPLASPDVLGLTMGASAAAVEGSAASCHRGGAVCTCSMAPRRRFPPSPGRDRHRPGRYPPCRYCRKPDNPARSAPPAPSPVPRGP